MNLLRRFSLAVVVTSLGMGTVLSADDKAKATAADRADHKASAKKVCQVSDAIGATVKNHQGKDLGAVNNIALTRNGEFKYAIIGYGGVAGVGETEVAVPWSEIEVNYAEKSIVLNMTPDRFERLPKIEDANYDVLSEQTWQAELDKHFAEAGGNEPGENNDAAQRTEREKRKGELTQDANTNRDAKVAGRDAADRDDNLAGGNLLLVNNLIGAYVKNQENESIGEVHDLIVLMDKSHMAKAGDRGNADNRASVNPTADVDEANRADAANRDRADAANRDKAHDAKKTHGMKPTHRVEFAILDIGGVVGIGETQVAMPFSQLNIRENDDALEIVTNMTQKQLENAPTLKKTEFEDLLDESFVSETRQFFGAREEIETEAQKKNRDQQNNLQNRDQKKNPTNPGNN